MTPDPSDPPRPPLSAMLDQLRQSYRVAAPLLIARFRELAGRLAADPSSAAALEGVQETSHRVRGTAGSYGFVQASELAAALEDRAGRWAADPRFELDLRSDVVIQFAEALEVAFQAV
jgi:chemotaxis protein histidine kinase CheA